MKIPFGSQASIFLYPNFNNFSMYAKLSCLFSTKNPIHLTVFYLNNNFESINRTNYLKKIFPLESEPRNKIFLLVIKLEISLQCGGFLFFRFTLCYFSYFSRNCTLKISQTSRHVLNLSLISCIHI